MKTAKVDTVYESCTFEAQHYFAIQFFLLRELKYALKGKKETENTIFKNFLKKCCKRLDNSQ